MAICFIEGLLQFLDILYLSQGRAVEISNQRRRTRAWKVPVGINETRQAACDRAGL